MPNLENLRKQAKQILRWHRERYHPVAAEIRAFIPRFHGLGDEAILGGSFKLADAQELVARKLGFDGWQALTSGATSMSERPIHPGTRPSLGPAVPCLFVSDIRAACAFFTLKLGFVEDFVHGDPPFYAQVKRDGATLALRRVEGQVFADDIRVREDLLAAILTLDRPEAIKHLFRNYQAVGVPFHQPLRKEPWGARTFIVQDPDGNLLLFAGPAE